MYYGGAAWLGWILMGFSIIATAALVIGLVLWSARSFRQDANINPPPLD